MWERFSTSGLAGSYVDELLAAGIEARMDFRPRRALDPLPFLVISIEDDKAEMAIAAAHGPANGAGALDIDPDAETKRGGRSRPETLTSSCRYRSRSICR